MFTDKCIIKKNIKKNAESAMAIFLPIEDLKNPLIFFEVIFYAHKNTLQEHYRQKLRHLNPYLERL